MYCRLGHYAGHVNMRRDDSDNLIGVFLRYNLYGLLWFVFGPATFDSKGTELQPKPAQYKIMEEGTMAIYVYAKMRTLFRR